MVTFTITVVTTGQHITVPARDGTSGFVGHDAPCDGLHFSSNSKDGECFFVPASVLREKLAELNHVLPPAAPPVRPPAPPTPAKPNGKPRPKARR